MYGHSCPEALGLGRLCLFLLHKRCGGMAMYKVLILDEDRGARYMLKRFPWSRYGFEISEEAAGGQEALAKLALEGVDLLVTDVRMPDMDGMDFLEAVNEQADHPCLILMSSYNDFEYAQQGIGLGVFDYMTKPFSEADFGQTLQRASIYLQKNHNVEDRRDETDRPHPVLHAEQAAAELEKLLLAGNPLFLAKVRQLEKELAGEKIFVCILEKLYAALDRTFPWVRNIEATVLREASPRHDSFSQDAAELFALMEKYELVRTKSLFRSICELVQQDIEADLSLHSIAAELGISADYAGRIFKKKTGLNFVTFVTRMKMERGKKLLEQGRIRNYEISARLGYSNPDYFRQLFKAHTGMTPTEYRNAYRRRVFR